MAIGRRLRRAFKQIKNAVTQAVDIVSDTAEFLFTGELHGTDGNDTLTAVGFEGTVYAEGGDDKVTAGAGVLRIKDTTGDLQVVGAAGKIGIIKTGEGDVTFQGASGKAAIKSVGNINFEGVAAENHLETTSNDATIYFRGASGSNKIKGAYETLTPTSRIDVDFTGAGGSNEISTRAATSKVMFNGAGLSNKISVVADNGEVAFTGAGASNQITVNTLANRVDGQQAMAEKFADAANTSLLDNYINTLGSYDFGQPTRAKVSFVGGGMDNQIDVGANLMDVDFEGAGASNWIRATGYGEASEADIYFVGAGAQNTIEALADKATVTFIGAGVENTIFVQSDNGLIDFAGGGASNVLDVRAQTDDSPESVARVVFNGAGGSNIINAEAAHADIQFRGAGAYNELVAVGMGTDGTAKVDFAGAGAYNVIDVIADQGTVRFDGAGAYNEIYLETRDGSVTFNGAGAANIVELLEKKEFVLVEVEPEPEPEQTGGSFKKLVNKILQTAPAETTPIYEEVEVDVYSEGDIVFNGAGLGNIVRSNVDRGDITFTGGGGANVVTSTVNDGDIHFTGIGYANVVSRLDRGQNSRGDIVFVGGGGANVVTSTVTEGDIDFTGAGALNVLTRDAGSGSDGDVRFTGAGLGNIVTHLTDHGDTVFSGGGGGNALTRIGQTGDVAFVGAGLANVIVQDVVAGDLEVTALGGGNLVTRSGAGRSTVTLGGGGNVFTATMGRGAEVAGPSDVDATMVGLGNGLFTDVTGKTTAIMTGRANVAEIRGEADVTAYGELNLITTGSEADRIRSFGVLNKITTSGDNNHIESYGAYSIIRDGGLDTEASETDGSPTLGDRIVGITDALIDTTVADISGGGGEGGGMFSDPSVYLDAFSDATALTEDTVAVDADPNAEAAATAARSEALTARGLTEADLAPPLPPSDPAVALDDDWSVLRDADLAARGSAGRDQEAISDIDPTALTATVDAERARFAADIERAQRSSDDAMAEAEAAGTAATQETDPDEDPNSVGEGDDIASIGDTEDDTGGVLGAKVGFGFEAVMGQNYNLAVLAGLANVLTTGTKNDLVFAASLGNYISTGDGNDVAVMLGLANVFRGGGGNDVAVQVAYGNVALMGEGAWDVAMQAGYRNFVNKDADGDLYALQLGYSNFVYHGGMTQGAEVETTGDLVAVMGGYLNVAHKMGDGDVTGILVGNVNSLSQIGDGRFVAVMLGYANVATKIGAGDVYMVMGGSANVATHVAADGAEATAVFLMAGYGNIATSVGHGLMAGVFLGDLNVVTKVGNGDMIVGMLGQGNILTQVQTETSDTIALVGGKVNALTKTGDGLLVAVGYGGIANVVTHVGDGSTIAVMIGKVNVITKVGDSARAGEDGATVLMGIGTANLLTHVGDGSTVLGATGRLNVATKIGDGTTVAALKGEANVVIHVGDGLLAGVSVSQARSSVPDPAKTVNSANGIANAMTEGAEETAEGNKKWDYLVSAFGDPTPPDWLTEALYTRRGTASGSKNPADRTADAFASLGGSVFAATSKAHDKLFGKTGTPSGAGQATDAILEATGQIQQATDPVPQTVQNAGPGFSANIAAKFGKGDVFFAQIGLDRKTVGAYKNDNDPSANGSDTGGELNAGADQAGQSDTLASVLSALSFDSSANIFLRIGDGRTVLAQRGSFNLSVNVVTTIDQSSDDETEFATGYRDHGWGFDYILGAVGDLNLSADVNMDRVFVAGVPWDLPKRDADGATITKRGRDSIVVMRGSHNIDLKVGDGNSLRALIGGVNGGFNISAKIGNGTDYSVVQGNFNVLFRLGSRVDGDDDNNASIQMGSYRLDGMKIVHGSHNFVLDYGRSNDVIMAIARQSETAETEDDTPSWLERQGTYATSVISTGGPFKSGKGFWSNVDYAAQSFMALTLFGFVPSALADEDPKDDPVKKAKANTSPYAKRSASTQTHTLLSLPSYLYSSFYGPKTPKSQTEKEAAYYSKNAGTYNDGRKLNTEILGIFGAYSEGLASGGNVVHAGAGADVIVTYGAGNIVFGDTITSLFTDFSFAALFPANAQALSLNEIIAMMANREVPTEATLNDDPAELQRAKTRREAQSTAYKAWDTFLGGMLTLLGTFQKVGDVGITIPYNTLGELFNFGYDANGAIVTYGVDADALKGQMLNSMWIDLVIPSSIFGGLAGMFAAGGINEIEGVNLFEMSGTWLESFGDLIPDMEGFGEREPEEPVESTPTEVDPLADLEQFMIDTNSGGDTFGELYSTAGIPVIAGIPNFTSLFLTLANFKDVVALGEGGPLDGLRNIAEKIHVLEGDGDVMVALGGGNMQFGGHGDDIMVTMGEVGHNFGGYGNDFLLAIGGYTYGNGNDGDDYLIALGSKNVLHDNMGHNTVIAVGNLNDIRLGRGNDAIFVLGNKSKARAGSGYNFITAYGSKNSIYLGGNDVVFAMGAENHYYILGGEGSRALVHNIGAASIVFSPGAKAYFEVRNGTIDGSEGDDYLAMARDSEFGEIVTDSSVGSEELRQQAAMDPDAFGAAYEALQNQGITTSNDTVVLRGLNPIVFGNGGGTKDRDYYVMGFGLKNGVIVDAGGEKMGFDGPTEDRIVIGERIGVANFGATLIDAPVMFERDGDDLVIYSPDHAVFRDSPAPLAEGEMNTLRVKDYFNTHTANAADVVLTLWTENAALSAQWQAYYEAEEARATAAAAAAGNEDIKGIHTWEDFSIAHYSYLDRDGIAAMIAAYDALRALPRNATLDPREIWEILWASEYDVVTGGVTGNAHVRIGTDLDKFKIGMKDGLFLTGGLDADLIVGTVHGDVIEGADGDDTLLGDAGDDTILGDRGNDRLDGGEGANDRVDYSSLRTAGVVVDLGQGLASYHMQDRTGQTVAYTDTLTGIEQVVGTSGADALTGSAGDDSLYGRTGADSLRGGDGNDLLISDGGARVIEGGAGDDTIALGAGFDATQAWVSEGAVIDGGDGVDVFDASAAGVGVAFDLETAELTSGDVVIRFAGIESVTGSSYDDTLRGGAGANRLDGGAGDDLFWGDLAGDSLVGGAGQDTLDLSARSEDILVGFDAAESVFALSLIGTFRIGSGADGQFSGIEQIWTGSGNDTLSGRSGLDEVFAAGLGQNTITGDLADADAASYAAMTSGVAVDLATGQATGIGFSDTLIGIARVYGSDFGDRLVAGEAAVEFFGGAGADTLTGSAGDDLLIGGAGSDLIDGGAGEDMVDFGVGGATAAVLADLDTGLATQGGDTDTLRGIENLAGGLGDDSLAGDAQANWLVGSDGHDTLEGRAGDDVLDGGAGDDVLLGGAGDDVLSGDAGDDTLISGGGQDVLIGGGGNDRFVVHAGSGNTVIEVPEAPDDDMDADTYLSTMDADSFDVMQIGDADESVTREDLWFRRREDHLMVDVIGADGSVLSTHQLSNWYLDTTATAHRMDAFEVGDQVLGQSGVAQLVQAMATWAAAPPADTTRHDALRENAALQGALAAAWQPQSQGYHTTLSA